MSALDGGRGDRTSWTMAHKSVMPRSTNQHTSSKRTHLSRPAFGPPGFPDPAILAQLVILFTASSSGEFMLPTFIAELCHGFVGL